MTNSEVHPCFSMTASHTHGRIHLPVAPKCNIQCNYCNRKTDCPNESRPGVTSTVLKPTQALEYLGKAIQHDPRISVAAIAGPGDAFANPEETMATLRGIRELYPHLVACLSTNGLNVLPYVQELQDLGVSYVTMTINAVDPIILSEVYSWVRFNRRTYRGVAAAQLLLERQMEALEAMKSRGFTVKVNTVVLPGINDHHIPTLAKQLSAFKIDRMNLIPVLQNENTFFEEVTPPTAEHLDEIRKEVALYVPLMTHCNRCRSDAAGLLGQDDPEFQKLLRDASQPLAADKPPRVAVASQEGIFVNQHLGEAESLLIFEPSENGYRVMAERATPPRGLGDARWETLAAELSDVQVLLVSGVGPRPLEILAAKGIQVCEVDGFVDEHLALLSKGELPKAKRSREEFQCGTECGGTGTGCMS